MSNACAFSSVELQLTGAAGSAMGLQEEKKNYTMFVCLHDSGNVTYWESEIGSRERTLYFTREYGAA